MEFKLSKSIQSGQKIKTEYGWRKVLSVNEVGAVVKEGMVVFGKTIYGWKAK